MYWKLIWKSWAKMYWKLMWKSPGVVPFGANLTHFKANSAIKSCRTNLLVKTVDVNDDLSSNLVRVADPARLVFLFVFPPSLTQTQQTLLHFPGGRQDLRGHFRKPGQTKHSFVWNYIFYMDLFINIYWFTWLGK